MKRSAVLRYARNLAFIILGCVVFAVGFDLFLAPNALNAGGMTGLAMVIVEVLGAGSIGAVTILLNVPLFILGYRKLGKEFFFGTLIGVSLSSMLLEVFLLLPPVETDPLLACIYGGLCSGLGLGLVFLAGASTGGSDIITRLLKFRFRELKMGRLMMILDLVVVALTGIVFRDISKSLYSIVTIYVCSVTLDGVLYGMDDSTVAMIITDRHEDVAQAIDKRLDRGVTFLKGQGFYSGKEKLVVLCAIRKRQVGLLKQVVSTTDPEAFVILQEAHQVLGKGFKPHSDHT